ncbi:CotH kinase family protein [candidate division KSB1 bacterium]|nr:CotH kinase family protein [candidate division KSB1 bacterium]
MEMGLQKGFREKFSQRAIHLYVIQLLLIVTQVDGAVPIFSHQRNFYQEKFDLELSSPLTNAAIAYTLDGSDPVISPTAIVVQSPHTVIIDPASSLHRALTPCVTVRAVLLTEGTVAGLSVTHTYIFIDQVIRQSNNGGRPGSEWPAPFTAGSSRQHIDYGMDLSVTSHPYYAANMRAALLDVPSLSIVTDLKHLFDPETGIYVNAQYHGVQWERPASLEWIDPDGAGFQINCGLRIRGGWSRHHDNPKHAFRLFFRGEYGETKLRYPLFGDEGVQEFDKLDLRTSQNYSWSYTGEEGAYNTMNRDVFSRDIQREMGQPYTRSRYCHLYLNGMYWGLFQTQERPEAAFAASYFGGGRDDYDVVKIDISDNFDLYEIEATDGSLDAWRMVWEACQKGLWQNGDYFRLQGRRWNGEPDPDGLVLVDIDNLIDYMIIIFYTGNFDAPVSKFRSNKDPNNFYAIYNRNGQSGFKFFAHDAEHTLLPDPITVGDGLGEDRVSIGSLSGGSRMSVSRFEKFHPQWLHFRLSQNREYLQRFGDRVHKYFFNKGLLTLENAAKHFQKRADEIDMAIIAESARWGDARFYRPRTKHEDWQPAINHVLVNWFPRRTEIVLEQLRRAGLYPSIEAPLIYAGGQVLHDSVLQVDAGYVLTLNNPNLNFGVVYFTQDGSDPRRIGGGVVAGALEARPEMILTVQTSQSLKARIQHDGSWSALQHVRFVVAEGLEAIRLTEIHYHPLAEVGVSSRDLEFIELKNIGRSVVTLDSSFFTGISFTFPPQSALAPGQFIVLAADAEAFARRYGLSPDGEYEDQLDDGGEVIAFLNKAKEVIWTVDYEDRYPWPASADGGGPSAVPTAIDPTDEQNRGDRWCASSTPHGSPGRDDPASALASNYTSRQHGCQLCQNYPNPCTDRTTFRFTLDEAGPVELRLYNLRGQFVTTVLSSTLQPGSYNFEWEAAAVPSGVYFYVLRTKNATEVKKLLHVQ